MNPPAPHRLAAALVAAAFLLGGAEHSFGLEGCPHHDAAFVGHGGPNEEGADGHAHHGGSSEAPESDSTDHGPCDCIGPCATASPTVVPATGSSAVPVGRESVEVSLTRRPDFTPPHFIPYLLPYPHAPPSLG